SHFSLATGRRSRSRRGPVEAWPRRWGRRSVEYSGDPEYLCLACGWWAADAGIGCGPRCCRRPAQRGAGRGQADRWRIRSVGGRGGVAVASVWVAAAGTYCLVNFWHCQETHCAVTGPGWTLAAALGFAAALAPGAALAWYRVSVETMVFVVVLAAGYGLESV